MIVLIAITIINAYPLVLLKLHAQLTLDTILQKEVHTKAPARY